MDNPNEGKSRAETERQIALAQMWLKELDERDAKEREAAQVRENIIAAAALKWAYGILSNRGKLGEKFADIPQQAFPRESLLARPAGLSETQVHNIKESFLSAVQGLVKG